MTVAPYASSRRRRAVTGALVATLLVLGLLTLRAFGAGPSVFLFALAAVGLVDLARGR